jgi:polysaccharide biosynthesis transport protein
VYELTQLIASLRRRRLQAFVLFLALLVLGAGAVMLWPPSYASSSQVLIKRPDTLPQGTTYPQIDALLTWNRDTNMETYMAMALRPAIAQHVIDQLGLRTTVRNFLMSSVTVTPVTNSDIIDITVNWPDPNVAAAAANAFANEFVAQQRTLAASQASEAAASLSIALRKAQLDLSNAERALTLFESAHELADSSTQTSSIIAAISDVQAKERVVDAERVQAQGQLSTFVGELAAIPARIDAGTVLSSSPRRDQIEQQLSQQQIALGLLREQFTDKYPEVISTQRQIASLEAVLAKTAPTEITSRNLEPNPLSTTLAGQAATLRAQVTGNLAELRVLHAQEAALQDQLRDLPADVSVLNALQRQVKSAEDIYNALQTNYFNAVVAKSMAVSDLSVIQEADPTLAAVRPPRLVSLVAITIVAFLATVAIIALLEWLAVSSLSLSEAR